MYNEMYEINKPAEKADAKRVLVVLIPTLIIIAAIVLFASSFSTMSAFHRDTLNVGSSKADTTMATDKRVTTAASTTQTTKATQAAVENAEPVIPEFNSFFVTAGSAETDICFANPAENADCFYISYELTAVVDGEEQVLYSSGLIKAGLSIDNITFDKALEMGEYEANLHIQPCAVNGTELEATDVDLMIFAM